MSVTLVVNGNEHQLDVDENMPLLWALRDHLSLSGTKFGCGRGLCGACTVHIDGVPARSCLTTVGAAVGRQIATIESLVDEMPDLVDAWVNENVAQCGYCQAGQLMSAAALLATNAMPSDSDIEAAMAGNICRCGAYGRIKRAIHVAAEGRS